MVKHRFALLLITVGAYAQKPGTVQWDLSQKIGPHTYERVLTLRADVEKGWHIYGVTQQAGGPMPLVLRIEPDASFQFSGAITGTQPQKHNDASFNLTTEYFTDTFSLQIPVKETGPTQGTGVPLAVRYQMCSETTCMPPRTIHLVAKSNTAS